MKRKRRLGIFVAVTLVLFVAIPLAVSLSYGNIPFLGLAKYRDYALINPLISQCLNHNQNQLQEFSNTKTLNQIGQKGDDKKLWDQIQSEVIRDQMNFSHVFHDVVIVTIIVFVSIVIDRSLFRKSFR